MHGLIFSELRRYALAKFGPTGWERALTEAKLGHKAYIVSEPYPDAEAVALVGAAARLANKQVPEVLDDFGAFIAPTLLNMYARLLKPEWRSLDVVEHAEATMHTVVRLRNKGATPPVLKAVRKSPHELHIFYGSHRKLCFLAAGIVRGIGAHFKDNLIIEHPKCMHAGAPQCEIVVRSAP